MLPEVFTTSLNDLWPMDTSTLLPSSIELRMHQERAANQERKRREAEGQEQGRRLTESGQPIGSPEGLSRRNRAITGIHPGMPGQQGPNLQPPEDTRAKGFSMEQAFAQFSVLQTVKRRLKQFGYEFFDLQASSFAAVQDVPVGPDYVVGPQDSLAVHVWNVPDPNLNRSYIVPVERDGMLVIPRVGAIPVGGLTFSQVERVIHSRLRKLLKRFEVHVAMARLRTIKVYVVGEVVRPGAYEVSALATVSNAVYAACGPAKSGSLRQVTVVRDGRVVAKLDFYDFLLKGDRTQDRRLQAGDVVLVPPLGAVAAISGAVKRSAIYEFKPGSRLTDLLQLAGGLTPVADQRRCHIFRMEPGRGRVLIGVDLAAALKATGKNGNARSRESEVDPIIQDGDYVRIAALPTQVANVVGLAGAVKNPGPYEYRPGMRVHDLLTRDQLTVDAYLDRAEIIRTDPVTYGTQVIQFSPVALFKGDQEQNHRLHRLDQIVVASQLRPPKLVVLEGEVKRPGYFTIEQGERLSSALKRAGGFTPNAFPPGMVLIRESVRQKQEAELERFIAGERQRLAAESAGVAAGTAQLPGGGASAEQQVLALRLQQLEAISSRVDLGRVVVRLDSIERLEGTEDDIRLEAGDRITIPQPPQTVSIIGSVKNPSNVVHRVGLSLQDYLDEAGGPTEDANLKQMYVMRANGATESAYVRVKEMQPGDTIVVPQKIEAKTPKLALWKSVASIVGSIALAAAGIAVIGR
ncbi:SLBB domain-containing protein [Nitrospiraceae bacterium AH_259_D15_M11_P09]|nr:SLBB domain-containing protein [Nitrospiraceae bacterium AH_259_D15_M11_P09]